MNPVRQFRYSADSAELLSSNKKHCNAQRFALCLYRQNAIYSYIPKNACSTMRLSLALANGCIGSASDHQWIHQNNATFVACLREMADAEYTFTILRCPYDRLVSVFMDKIVRGGEGHKQLSFSGFIDLLAGKNMLKRNLHWRPQIDFLVYRTYDDVYSVENISQMIPRLKQRLDFEVVDARPYTGHGREQLVRLADLDYSNTTVNQLRSMLQAGTTPETGAFYSSRCIEMVNGLYREDFQLYGENLGSSALMRRFGNS